MNEKNIKNKSNYFQKVVDCGYYLWYHKDTQREDICFLEHTDYH